jgi:N-methylhydantoinase A
MVSGPVAGILGAEYFAANFLDVPNLVCIDIGGTSTDLGLVIDGVAQSVSEWEAEWALTLGMPAVDVRSIGAGGGSLIQTDAMGTLRVGPESAGAQPGPVAYGRGGTEPTVTDAHAVLGTMRPETFLGGRMKLEVEAAAEAMGALAERLDLPRERLAEGALQMMNANIESEISKMVFERGVDIRDFSLFAYGGAGALHAVDVARAAGISEVIVPALAGGFSAMGLATAPPKVEQALSRVGSLDAFELSELNELFDGMEERMRADLHAQGVADADISVTRSVSAMYTGQGFANELELAGWPLTDDIIEEWKGRFHNLYDRLYGYSAPEMGITVTTLSLVAVGPRLAFTLPEVQAGGEEPPADALDGHHPLQLGGTRSDVPFYVRDRLLAGNRIPGPAVIEDAMTTIVVPAGATAAVDNYGTVRIAC